MGMIQNPTKSFTVDKSVNDVKQITNRITEFTSKCKLISSDDIIYEYEFDFSTLMIGNIITLSLNEISKNKTEIKLEARRVMGAYDQSIEITTANLDLKSITKAISTLISDPKSSSPLQVKNAKRLEKKKERDDAIAANILKSKLEKENNPALYHTKQTALVLLTIALLGGFGTLLYFAFK